MRGLCEDTTAGSVLELLTSAITMLPSRLSHCLTHTKSRGEMIPRPCGAVTLYLQTVRVCVCVCVRAFDMSAL